MCIAHDLCRVCEIFRMFYSAVEKLVANGKEIFVLPQAEIEIFKTKLQTDQPLPPTLVITR